MTFSKMAPRTSTPKGSTKGQPKAAPTSMHKELTMNRITVAFLAEQQAATNAQMDRLMGTVERLVGIVAAVIPQVLPESVAVAQSVPQAAPVVQAAASVAAAAETAIDKRNAALARGRETAARNRAARKAASTAPAPEAAPAPAPETAAPAAAAPKVTQLTKVRQNNTTAHIGTIGAASYVVAWNRTAAAWDWQISVKGGKTVKGRVPNGDAARAVAFRNLNAAAVKLGQAQVRAGK